MNITELTAEVKKGRKYRHLADEAVKAEIERYIKKNPHIDRYKKKKIIKDIRAKLYKTSASFQAPNSAKKEREELLKALDKNPQNLEIIEKILETNRSTKERIGMYPELYEEIFSITSEPESIIDLGCGINPISFPYMGLRQVYYRAYDIDERDIDFLNNFFELMEIEGKAETRSLTDIDNFKTIDSADICFMFKFLDVVEKKGHKYSEEIVQVMAEKCKFIAVSFAMQTVGGKSMNFPARGWIERMLVRIGLKFKRLEFPGETFYVIWKKKI